VDFDDPKDWTQTLQHWAIYFQRVMSMALAIFFTILHVKDILHIGVLFLEGKGTDKNLRKIQKIVLLAIYPIEGTIWPKLVVVLASYKCNK
jgi:hypothetical protein